MEDLTLKESEELERCPFCGGGVVFVTVHYKDGDRHRFLCRSEECLMGDFEIIGIEKESVKAWWNTRC